jgi:hypothetical protein
MIFIFLIVAKHIDFLRRFEESSRRWVMGLCGQIRSDEVEQLAEGARLSRSRA